MKTQLNAPISPRTDDALERLEEFRAEHGLGMIQSDPRRLDEAKFRKWIQLDLPTDLRNAVRTSHFTQRNIWKSVVYNIDTSSGDNPEGHNIATTSLIIVTMITLVMTLMQVGNMGATALFLFLVMPVTGFITWKLASAFASWGESAHHMDMTMVTAYHKNLTDQFDELVAELADAYSEDLRRAGFQITDTETGVIGPRWNTRYTATNGIVTVHGDLTDDGDISTTVGQSDANPEWMAGITEDYDYGTVLDLDGNAITPIGMTTKGIWA